MSLNIEYGSLNPSKVYNINENEELFFENLTSKLKQNKLNQSIYLTRMSNGSISVDYSNYPIGKIKLQGRKYSMLILKNMYDNYTIEGSLDDFILKIDEWINYIKKFL